jgi:hypothetical protein
MPLEHGDIRAAAACYWTLLRSHRLAPAAARGVAANLRRCRPGLTPRLGRHLEHILREHDARTLTATRVLSALRRPRTRLETD